MNVKGFMPPQGLLVIAALLPEEWKVRFVDENIRMAEASDFEWADAVFTSGMHIQRNTVHDIARRAHAAGKVVALGGPSVSAAPQFYPSVDLLHLGEAGDATLQLFELLDETVERPDEQIVFRSQDRLPMLQFPTPAYDRIRVADYLMGSVQFSSGCPFTCEFCDIPALYGRNPRLKAPEQVIRELDELADGGAVLIYFVDDNFVANPRAAEELLPHLVDWQKRRDYHVRLACEASLNITRYPQILKGMQEAFFTNLFVGIETPEPEALMAMSKRQNLRSPILESVSAINRHGMEVASGIIMGLDTDTPQTAQALIDFARESNVPIMTVNIVYALPHTPLYDRLEKDGRILTEEESVGRDSNIRFLIPYEEVLRRWRRVVQEIYTPETLYRRYLYNAAHTYPNRHRPTRPLALVTWRTVKRAVGIFLRICWKAGVVGDYRRVFWKMTLGQLSRGHVETMFQVAMAAHHLITYSRECTEGKMQASHFSERSVDAYSPHAVRSA